jgi:hypothetical protein
MKIKLSELKKLIRETVLAEALSVHDHIESLIDTVESSDVNSFKEYFSGEVDAAAEAAGWDRKIFNALEEKAKNIIDAMRVAADARGHRGKNVDSPEFAKAKEEVLQLAKDFGIKNEGKAYLSEFWGKKKDKKESSEIDKFSDPLGAANKSMSSVVSALWGPWDDAPYPDLLKKAQDLHAEILDRIKNSKK